MQYVDIYIKNVYSITESVGKEITKECSKIFPLQNVLIKKVKVLKKPKFDLTKLMELYQDKPEAPKAAATEEAKNILAEEWSDDWPKKIGVRYLP